MSLFGAVEIGGTKTYMAVGTSPSDLSPPHRLTTTSPSQTLAEVARYFGAHRVDAVGVACFGPLQLASGSKTFGSMLNTPKRGWSGVAVYDDLSSGIDAPVAIDTDVNGAALGEGRWGNASGMSDYVYVTVGTGIGAGIVVGGDVIGGERHPEMGHIVVSRRTGDAFAGMCPYHGDCLEGMTAGPALEARFGRPETWAGNDSVVVLAAHYVAQGMRNLIYTVAPERIIIGGGVSTLPGFHDRVRSELAALLASYPEDPDLDLLISKPGLGELSGLAGALVIAGSEEA